MPLYPVNEATEYVEEKAGGETRRFYLLNYYDRAEIAADLKRKRREMLIANLDAAGLPPEQKIAELEAFEDNWNDQREFIRFVNSAAANVDIPLRALRIEDKDAARKIVQSLRLPLGQILALKAALTGLDMVEPAAAPQQGEPPANPPTPPVAYNRPPEDENTGTNAA